MADVLLLCSSCSNLLSTCQLQEVAVNEKRIYTIAASFGYVVNGKVHILAACSIIVCVAVVQHVLDLAIWASILPFVCVQ